MTALSILGITAAVILLPLLGLAVYTCLGRLGKAEFERRQKEEHDRVVRELFRMTQKLDISEEEKDEKNID